MFALEPNTKTRQRTGVATEVNAVRGHAEVAVVDAFARVERVADA